jgi:hypothetical protein
MGAVGILRALLRLSRAVAVLLGASACLLDKTGYIALEAEDGTGGGHGAGGAGGGGAGGASATSTTSSSTSATLTATTSSGGGSGGMGGSSSAAPACWDGVQNQSESDVDCGGPCTPCGFGRACADDADCTVVCESGRCVPAPVAVWALQPTAHAPSQRYLPRLSYDANRKRTVLFGGFETQDIAPVDTWEYDGVDWTVVPTAIMPGRILHMMAYDTNRGVTVVFGGISPQGYAFPETYEYKGIGWSTPMPSISPKPRWAGAMAFDAKRNEMVLFGGMDSAMAYDETWVYDGVAWKQRTPQHRPSPRISAAMTYDAARHVLVLFGGSFPGTPAISLNETWTWDGSDWTLAQAATAPAPRSEAALTFDPIRSRAVLFGGSNALGLFADTWEWDGATWTLIAPTMPGPAASYGNPLVFDLARRRAFFYESWTGVGFPARSWDYYALATPCAQLSECGSGACVDGLCCEEECGGTCAACNLPKTPGRCAPIVGADDLDTCADDKTCDSGGQCVPK